MNKSSKFFSKIFCGIILCLATCGCAKIEQEATGSAAEIRVTTPSSEVIAVETVSDQVPANVALGDDWCYFRFNLNREQLTEIADTIDEHPEGEITLSLPDCTPDDDPFFIKISHEDVKRSLKLLEKYPEQESVNLIKAMPADTLANFEEPEAGLHYVYYLLTKDDIARMLVYLQDVGADTLILSQRLNINDDNLAEFRIQQSMLQECVRIFQQTGQPYIVYVCQVAPLETV